MSRVAVVTGAGRGIGRAACLALAEQGFALGLMSRTQAQLEEVAREIEGQGGRAIAVPGDVTQAEAAGELIERTAEAFGGVDLGVAAAGQALSAPVVRTSPEQMRGLFEVNALAPFHLLKATASHLMERGASGQVVVVASTAAVRGFRYTAAYSASKHAVLGLVRSAAMELAPKGIRVNAVCPGWVDTEMFTQTLENISKKTGRSLEEARSSIESMVPMGRVLRPEEVADMIVYLTQPGAEMLTGQSLVIDGGESL